MQILDGPPRPTTWSSPASAYRVTVGAQLWELRDVTLPEVLAWAEVQAGGGPYELDAVTPHGPGLVRLVGEEAAPSVPVAPTTAVRSRTIPEGLTVSLSRAKVKAGASPEADRWMQMLEERVDECVATLDAERMGVEIIFRLQEDGEDFLWWVSVHGEGAGLNVENPIDRDHVEQARRTKEPGWVEAEPQLLLLPAPVRAAIEQWCLRP